MRTFNTWTLGCKVNQYETEALEEILEEEGYQKVSNNEAADVTIINTCTVTNMSDRKSRQIIRRAKRLSPHGVIVVAGCYAQISPEEVGAIEGVDIIMGTTGRSHLPQYIEQVRMDQVRILAVEDHKQSESFEDLQIQNTEGRTRAYMKVQDGCNQYCSYCIIPYARGYIRSRPLEDAYLEAKRLGQRGFKEIVLTGIHIGSYGKDLEEEVGLIDLIEKIADIEEIKRIRLSSVEPMTITEDFMKRASACGKLMDHFHLSLQSGCDKVLNEMNRKYTTAEYRKTVERIRKYMPYAGITTDVIVGFPGESEEDFKETLEFVTSIGFSRIHVFSYSRRDGTPAAKRKDQISGVVKQDRSKRLIALGEELSEKFIGQNLNRDLSILFEEEEEGVHYGYSSNYIRVKGIGENDLSNHLAYGKIKEVGKEPILCTNIRELD